MQEHDARILAGAAIPTAAAGLIAMVIAFFAAGVHGLVGALVGTVLIIVFFAISAVIIAVVAKRQPQLVLMAALATYTLKAVALAIVLLLFGGAEVFDLNAFAVTAGVCVVVWLTGHSVASLKVRRLYIEPVESPADPESAEGAGAGEHAEAKP
ncbi:hypothetical protein ACFO4E_21820 [Nocardiopsis mangrovi]|uniref:ATP synthase protein I n=1 Tax=Nocardiopsis mangrovi TaxID=1179818 RepID=A0ABV9E1D2_9ACTN